MIVLGIDPGLATIGYGIIEANRGVYKDIDYGVILTPKEKSIPERLKMIYDGICLLIDEFKPDEIGIEKLFFAKNVKTALNVSEARGVIQLACINKCGKLYEYTPNEIKIAVTGYGRADKQQIQTMVKVLLSLPSIPRPDDAADALAIALCHAQTHKYGEEYRLT